MKLDYLARKESKLKCKERELESKEKQLMELKILKKESQVWEYIGKFRKKKKKGTCKNYISLDQWKSHFEKLLKGSNSRKTGEKRNY